MDSFGCTSVERSERKSVCEVGKSPLRKFRSPDDGFRPTWRAAQVRRFDRTSRSAYLQYTLIYSQIELDHESARPKGVVWYCAAALSGPSVLPLFPGIQSRPRAVCVHC